MAETPTPGYIALQAGEPIWERCFMVHPLVIVGTRERGGEPDLAPKHMATPLSWEDHFGFVCAETHATYRNAKREGCFTVSFPRPEQVVLASLAAAPRCADDQKHSLEALSLIPARRVDGVLLEQAYLHLECELDRVVDGFGPNSLVVGRVVAGQVAEEYDREADVDDQELVSHAPLLVYVNPGRFARLDRTLSFPFHEGFKR